jgi:hypothetical protein
MEDRVYDKMEDYLKTLNPTSSVLEKVGTWQRWLIMLHYLKGVKND